MKYLILEQRQIDTVTGGQAVNKRLYADIEQCGHQVVFSSATMPNSGNWQFIFSNLFNLRKYGKYDKIFIDSSYFPKTIWFVLLFGLVYGKQKIITTLHHFIHENITGLKGWIYRHLEILFIKRCGEIIVFSPYVLDRCTGYVERSRISYLGLAFEKNIMPSQKKEYGKLLFVGTIEQRKGLLFLIEALHTISKQLLQKIELNIVGKVVDTNYLKLLNEKVKNYHLENQVHFRGRVSNEELKYYYDTSMIFTFPSLLEGFGLVLVEAMGHGLPVIAFNNSAIPYTVKTSVNGFVVNNMNSTEFGSSIERLLNEPETYKQLSEGAFQTYQNARTYEDFDRDAFTIISKHSGI